MENETDGLEIISGSSIQIQEMVGAGGFGTVVRAKHEGWGQVAMKKLSTNFIERRTRQRLIREAEKLHKLSHPNIIQMLGLVMEESCYALVLEYMEHGALDGFLDAYRTSWAMKMDFIEGIVLAMNYLHTRTSAIIHRDLKPPNVLVGRDFRVKVCDFGLSMWRSYSKNYTNHSTRDVGTVTHVPPEAWADLSLTPAPAYDIYSFGILVWEVCTQEAPFACVARALIMQGVQEGQRPSTDRLPTDTPHVLKRIMEDCWVQDPQYRPAFRFIKEALDRDTLRQDTDMERERLLLMRTIATLEGDLEEDGGSRLENTPRTAFNNNLAALRIGDPSTANSGSSPSTPDRRIPSEPVGVPYVSPVCQPTENETQPEYPASTLMSAQHDCYNTPLSSVSAETVEPYPDLNRPLERQVQPMYPHSAQFSTHSPQTQGSQEGVRGTNAPLMQPQSLHINTLVEPEIDGDMESNIYENQTRSSSVVGAGQPCRTVPMRRVEGSENAPRVDSRTSRQSTNQTVNQPMTRVSQLPRDTEPDAEPDSLQSLPSPQDQSQVTMESLRGTGSQSAPTSTATQKGNHPQTQQQGVPPNQDLPGFMKGFLPNFKVELPDPSKCSSYVVHQRDGLGTTVICSSENGKRNNIQIGDHNVMHIHRGSRSNTGPGLGRQTGQGALKISRDKITKSTKVIDSENMDILSKHLGKYWKALGRNLGFSSGELDQINADYHVDGLAEKIRQMLEQWRVREGKAATLGLLADKLWKIERYDIAVLLK